jgi:ribulose-phosphate 3-epimerase
MIDLLLVMGVNPGWSGQKFNEAVLQKIKDIRKHYPKLDIAVDGGVTETNASKILESGANILSANSMIYIYRDDAVGMKKMLQEIKKHDTKAIRKKS